MPYSKDTGQLKLSFGLDSEYIRRLFEKAVGKTVSLILTDNSTSVISVRTHEARVFVRLQRIFLRADGDVVEELTEFVRGRKKRLPAVRRFMRLHRDDLKKSPLRKTCLRTEGSCHSLKDIYNSVNREYFENRIKCSITWGSRSSIRAARNRTMGSYIDSVGTIRINPVLDRRSVPRYYVEFIVYHEMLHADMGVGEKNGRRIVHSKEFRAREKLFRDYIKAIEWEKRKQP